MITVNPNDVCVVLYFCFFKPHLLIAFSFMSGKLNVNVHGMSFICDCI